jgi:D-alanine transaminase
MGAGAGIDPVAPHPARELSYHHGSVRPSCAESVTLLREARGGQDDGNADTLHTVERNASMQVLACLNGEIVPVEQARVPVWDRGFLFGDSVYEVFRMYRGRCWLEQEHLARLKRSLAELRFEPYDLDRLMERVRATIQASEIVEGTVYIQITRGVAPRAHPFPDPPVTPAEVIIVRPYDDGPTARLRETGVALISHPDLRWKRCDIKSTNLLANVLAIETARKAGAFEAVLLDSEGRVTEATHTSLLWVRGGRLEGTPEGHEILPGMTRQLVLRLVESLGIPFSGARVTLDELKRADEVLLVGTTTEVLPVVRIDEASVGEGRPGPTARRLQEAYERALSTWLEHEPGMDSLSQPSARGAE